MKSTNAFFFAGITAATLGLAAVFMTSSDQKASEPKVKETIVKAEQDVTPKQDYANAQPVVVEGQPTWAEINNYTKYKSLSQFVEVIRSSHIAIGVVTKAPYGSNRVKITFEPSYYIKGTPLAQSEVELITDNNADLRSLIGQTVTIAFLEGTRNGQVVYGACHGIDSITPEKFNVDASIDFYTDMLDIYERYEEGVQAGLAENPEDGRFPFPEAFVLESKELLINTLSLSGTQAAHSAARELFNNPLFVDAMTADDIERVADAVRASKPQTFDRGYGLKILDLHHSTSITVDDAMKIVRDEPALINIDHLAIYMNHNLSHGPVVRALASIYLNESEEESTQAIRNSLECAWLFGSKDSLPFMDLALGTLTDRSAQRAILKAYAGMHAERNLEPLVVYMNGGVPSEVDGSVRIIGDKAGATIVRKQNDCTESRELLKRTILAIAMIDNDDSNMLLRKMHTAAKTEWMQTYLMMLREENKDWRVLHELLEEDG